MSRYRSEQSDSDFLTDVFKIALGVFIGGLLAAFVFNKYIAWEMERAFGPFSAALNRDAKRMGQEATRLFQQSDQQRQQLEQQRQQREAVEQIERDAQAEKARQKRLQQQAEADRDARRQAAWERYYQASALCKVDSATLACANEFMAAKKRFLEQYRD